MLSNEFITECMAGNEGAIQGLVRTHQRGVFQMALSVLDRGEIPAETLLEMAEMVTRDSFGYVIAHLGRYRPDMLFENWLYSIVIEKAMRRVAAWRRWNFIRRLFHFGDQAQPDLNGQTTQLHSKIDTARQSDDQIWRAVCGLKDSLRLPVILRYYHDFPVERIARILHISQGAVHARLDQAREKMVAGVQVKGVT